MGSVVQELGVVDFEFDSGGPSKICAWLPRTTPSGTTQLWQPRYVSFDLSSASNLSENGLSRVCRLESENMESCVDSDRTTDRLIRLVLVWRFIDSVSHLLILRGRQVNKKPKWDEAHGGHVLNFQVPICVAIVNSLIGYSLLVA